MTNKLAQSYVWREGKCFFISTINRPSSAAGYPGIYAETMAWEVDPETCERKSDRILYQGEAARDSISGHINAMKAFFVFGTGESV